MAEVDTTAANATENVNTTEGAPQTEGATEQTNTLGLTAEQAEQFKKFLDSNGGYDKVFDKVKTAVTARETDKKGEPKVEDTKPEQPANTPVQPQPQEAPKMAEGYVSPQEFAIKQYFKAVAAEEKYAPIAKDIESGAVLKEMESLGIKATDDNGNYNDAMIHRFLDLKAKTVPATPSVVEPTNTPTVTYTSTEGEVTSLEQALKIREENRLGLAHGGAGHPNIEAANKYIDTQFGKKEK